jgi:hypothetical protein
LTTNVSSNSNIPGRIWRLGKGYIDRVRDRVDDALDAAEAAQAEDELKDPADTPPPGPAGPGVNRTNNAGSAPARFDWNDTSPRRHDARGRRAHSAAPAAMWRRAAN